MEKHEAIAKTADEAIEEILSKLEVTIDEIDIEMEEVRKGFLGMSKQIKVTAQLKGKKSVSKKTQDKDEGKKNIENSKIVKEIKKEEKQEDSLLVKERISNPDLINDPEDVIRGFLGNLGNNIGGISEVNVKVDEKTVKIEISGEDVSVLIGKHGRTLDAIRSLLSLMINRGRAKDDLKRVLLDVEGYRKKRDNTLERLARNTATKVIKTKKEISMEPMNPYERRIIHSVLQRNKLVSTRSEGEEPSRYVVVFLK